MLAIPVLYSDLSHAFGHLLFLIGWDGIAEAVFMPLSVVFALRIWLFMRGVYARRVKLSLGLLPCFFGRHDYVVVNRSGESDDYFDYYTVDSKCKKCSSTHLESAARPSINWYY